VREPIGKMTPTLAWERAARRGRRLLADSANPADDADFRDAIATILASLLPTTGVQLPSIDTMAYKVIGALNALPELRSVMTDKAWRTYQQLVQRQAEHERDIDAVLALARQLDAMRLGLTSRQWLDRAWHHVQWGVPHDARV
jgi:hypothetical protein